MLFLKTTDKMWIENYNDFDICDIKITEEELDLPMSEFIKILRERISSFDFKDVVLFKINVDELEKDEVEYIRHFIIEVIAEALSGEKLNGDWQPRTEISKQLDATIKAQAAFLNYDIEPAILNIAFIKDGITIYQLVQQ